MLFMKKLLFQNKKVFSEKTDNLKEVRHREINALQL